jgi:glycosyltransferase involved in cell wall biosynthesis
MIISGTAMPEFGDSPLVTIAIPTFNRASWLGDCIAAALAQTYQHFEVLVSDNASTDDTALILKRINDQRLRVVRQPTNIGLIENWNATLAEAKGDYIVFVSDDDRIAPGLLERCMSVVRSQPQIAIVAALSDVHFLADGRTWAAPVSTTLRTGVCDGLDILREFLREQISVPLCSIVIRTEVLREEGGFRVDLPYSGDHLVCASIWLTKQSGFVNESCGTVCVHSDNETSRLALETRLRCVRKVVVSILAMADQFVPERRRRRRIKLEAQRYFARHAVRTLASWRKQGTHLVDMLPLIWEWRGDLRRMGFQDVIQLSKPIAILLIPGATIRSIVKLARTLRWKRSVPHIARRPQGETKRN